MSVKPDKIPDYNAIALAKVERAGTLIPAIRKMKSAKIRELCGIANDGKPNPKGFSPRKVRNWLVNNLPGILERKRLERLVGLAQQVIQLEVGEKNTTLTIDEFDRILVSEREMLVSEREVV